MKKVYLVLFILFSLVITSCSSFEYVTLNEPTIIENSKGGVERILNEKTNVYLSKYKNEEGKHRIKWRKSNRDNFTYGWVKYPNYSLNKNNSNSYKSESLYNSSYKSEKDSNLYDYYSPQYSPSYTPSSSKGGRVHVRGYYRKDGTYVRPHTRSAPRRK